MPVGEVQLRLEQLLDEPGALQELCSRAYAEATEVFAEAEGVAAARIVSVQSLTAYANGDSFVVPIRWLVIGPSGQLFPIIDADLELTPHSANDTFIRVRGSYRPPRNAAREVSGAALDQAVLNRFALVSVRSFVRGTAEIVATPVPDAVVDPAPGSRSRSARRGVLRRR